MKKVQTIAVYYAGDENHRLVGRLTMDGRRPVFAYEKSWLVDGLPLSPITMPLDAPNAHQLYYGGHQSSQYLCGLLADSLPDGWGMLLMDRFFRQELGKQPHEINVLDRFAYIGQNAMGALIFKPEYHIDENDTLDLMTLAQANQQVLAGKDTDILQQLLLVGGSPQGARPKAQVYYEPQSQTVSTVQTPNSEAWLVKFPAHNEHKSVCMLESIYADYVKKAGIIMPEHRYFEISNEYAAFGVKRFDRNGTKLKEQRLHIHTLAGLLNTDFRLPTLDYTQLLRCVRMMTHSQKQVEMAYRQAVFNVIFNNKDDHSKNFSFIMDNNGKWSLSPAYDISFNTGTNGHHQMDICGQAKHPTKDDLLQLAKITDIKPNFAKETIEKTVVLAEELLGSLGNYDLHKELADTVRKSVQENIGRM